MGIIETTLGLAMRAGALVSGEDACFRAIRSGKAKLIVIASDAGANTAKKFRDKCAYYHVPLLAPLEKDGLGRAIGKDTRTVVAVVTAQFANLIAERCGSTLDAEV